MQVLKTIIFFVNLISALLLIFLVLIQHGKGAEAGANFGSGSSAQGIFGSSGSANFLSKTTAICVIIFFSTCLLLAFITTKSYNLRLQKIIPDETKNIPSSIQDKNKDIQDITPNSTNLNKSIDNKKVEDNKIPE